MSENNNKHHAPRKRGGQPRNYNAYKHGLYSQHLGSLPDDVLSDLNIHDVEEEIQVVRVMIARHLKMRATNPPSSPEESLTDLRVISFAVARLASLVRLAKNLPAEKEVFYSENWMDELLAEILSEHEDDQASDPNDLIH